MDAKHCIKCGVEWLGEDGWKYTADGYLVCPDDQLKGWGRTRKADA